MNNIGIIIQARTGSKRFPNKVLTPFWKSHSILEIITNNLRAINQKIVIATSTATGDDLIESFAREKGIDVYRGNENDVLQRFIETAKYFHFNNIIRVCADNPFLDIPSITELIEAAKTKETEYIGIKVKDKPGIQTHFGLWAEFVTLEALKKVNQLTNQPLYHEHVTNYIYNNPEKFSIYWIDKTEKFGELEGRLRFTIDTPADFKNMQKLINKLSENDTNSLISTSLKSNEILNEMQNQIQENGK